MKKMTAVLSLILTAALLLTLAGCGDPETTVSDPTASAAESGQITTDPTDTASESGQITAEQTGTTAPDTDPDPTEKETAGASGEFITVHFGDDTTAPAKGGTTTTTKKGTTTTTKNTTTTTKKATTTTNNTTTTTTKSGGSTGFDDGSIELPFVEFDD